MKTFKKFFFLSALVAIVFASFTTETQAQTRKSGEPVMVFNADDADQWYVSRIGERVPDGETVLATSKRDRTQIIAKVRDGKIVAAGYKPVGKAFVVFPTQNAGPCIPSGFCYSWQIMRCFPIPGGGCICICGSWISAG